MLGWLHLLIANGEPGAQAADAAKREQISLFDWMLLLGPMILLFYFVVILPERRRSKQKDEQLKALKKNDRVVTIGGIYGLVVNVKPDADEVVLKVDEDNNVKLVVTKSSIARIISKSEGERTA